MGPPLNPKPSPPPPCRDVLRDLRVGPPLLLVVNNLNVSREAPDINRVCSVSGCDPNSLLNQVAGRGRGERE